MKVKLDIPYPEVKVEKENLEYAEILSEDYAGLKSETTAIFLYSYQNFEKFKENKEFAKIIEEISVVEMRHLEMLGKTIKLLGKNPTFETCETLCRNCVMWNAGTLKYQNNLKDMLKQDIEGEKNAITTYKLHRDIIDDKYIKEMLSRIILDEEKHLEIFETLYKSIN